MSVRKILIPLDNSTVSEQIVPVVQQLFDAADVDLMLMSVAQVMAPIQNPRFMPTGYPSYVEPLDYATAVDRETWQQQWERERQVLEVGLHAVQKRLQDAGYRVDAALRIGDPVQEIVTYAEDGGFDLLAMATHGRTGLGRFMFGSVTETVLRNVTVPVLLMRPTLQIAETAQPSGKKRGTTSVARAPMTIAVATDGSSHGQQALTLANELSQALNAELKLLVTVDEHADAAHAQHMMQATMAELDRLHIKPETVPLVGRIDVNVERYMAENPADILVIGAFKDKGAGASPAIGATAQQIVQHTPTSVLVAKGHSKQIRTMLACIAPDDIVVLAEAIQFAQALNADLSVLHVLPESDEQKPYLVDMSNVPLNEILARGPISREAAAGSVTTLTVDEAMAEANASARTAIANFLEAATAMLEVNNVNRNGLTVCHGPIVESILHVAQETKPDLLVLGSQSGPGYFMGSAASAVVGLAPQSVLVVRTKEK